MPLELNGKPYTITDQATLRKYSREMVFTVSRQYIKKNRDPEMRPIETAPIHIPTAYNCYTMENGLRISQGILRYYEAHNTYNENGRTVDNFTPQYIAIGHSGVMKSSNMELNYFLDNCPWNEKVKNDSLHPNFNNKVESMCNTFSRDERASKELTQQKMAGEMMMSLLDESVYPIDRMKSLAKAVSAQATARKMAHKLFDLDTMSDVALRAELIRLATTYTSAMNDIMNMDSTDMFEEIEKWKSLRVIEFTPENEWVFWDTNTTKKPIVAVPMNADPIETLVYYLKNHDAFMRWFKPIQERYKLVSKHLAIKQKKEKAQQEA